MKPMSGDESGFNKRLKKIQQGIGLNKRNHKGIVYSKPFLNSCIELNLPITGATAVVNTNYFSSRESLTLICGTCAKQVAL